MDFKKDIVLENAFVLLRPMQLNDYCLLEPFVLTEIEIWKYSLSVINAPAHLKHYIQSAVDARSSEKEYPFIVFDKTQNAYAGSTRFYDIELKNKTLHIGYTWYGKKHQGTKLNKNCKFLLLSYAIEVLNMERVEFRADNRNERSKMAMKSIGCVEEGVLRNHLPTQDGGRRDSAVFSITKDDWYNSVKALLQEKI